VDKDSISLRVDHQMVHLSCIQHVLQEEWEGDFWNWLHRGSQEIGQHGYSCVEREPRPLVRVSAPSPSLSSSLFLWEWQWVSSAVVTVIVSPSPSQSGCQLCVLAVVRQ
jgi:hypothetical protein